MAFSEQIAVATIAMEARNQDIATQLAVAFTLLNRVRDGRWGSNLASVCLAREQFSSWNTSDPNRQWLASAQNGDPALLTAAEVLKEAVNGSVVDPSHGATHYYSTDIPPPQWAAKARFLVQRGALRFYDQVP